MTTATKDFLITRVSGDVYYIRYLSKRGVEWQNDNLPIDSHNGSYRSAQRIAERITAAGLTVEWKHGE